MSSISSLVSTAASDESSSADSSYYSPRNERKASQVRRRSSTVKTRGLKVAKQENGGKEKVLCTCLGCEGKRMVSKSTCYRHLRIEAEMAEDDAKWETRWQYATPTSAQEQPQTARLAMDTTF